MNSNQKIIMTQKATQLALKKLSSFAAISSAQTQKRALSFLKPATKQQSPPMVESLTKSKLGIHLPIMNQKSAEKVNELLMMQQKMDAIKNFKQPFNFMVQDEKLQQSHIDLFWNIDGKGGNTGSKWEEWLRDKGLIRGDEDSADERQAHGWTTNDDLSDIEDDAWIAGGLRRPGEKDSEEFTTEQEMSEWEEDDDDDDHGGQMMPLPSM